MANGGDTIVNRCQSFVQSLADIWLRVVSHRPHACITYHIWWIIKHCHFRQTSFCNVFYTPIWFSFHTNYMGFFFHLIYKSALKVVQKYKQTELPVTTRKLSRLLHLFCNHASIDKLDEIKCTQICVCFWLSMMQLHDYMTVIIVPFGCEWPKWHSGSGWLCVVFVNLRGKLLSFWKNTGLISENGFKCKMQSNCTLREWNCTHLGN